MNKLTVIFPILSLLLCFTACSDELLLFPETEKVANNFYRNEQEVEEAVNAVYSALKLTGVYDLGMLAVGEIPGEDAYDETPANDGGVYGQLDMFNVISQNGLIADIWKDNYIGIQYANIVLSRIQPVTYANASTKTARIGEMKFIRALLYFNLVRTFGDIPLVIEEVANPQSYFGQKRTPKDEVYEQIRIDLKEAIDELPDRTEQNKHHAVKTAAQALLGKVEFTLGNYTVARTYLSEVAKTGSPHGLLDDPAQVFALTNELNREIIFAVQFAGGLNSNTEGTDAYRMFNPTGRVEGRMSGTKGHGVLKSEFYNLYADNDKRKDVYVKILPSGLAYSNKISVPTTVITDSGSDFVVLRFADVLLMLAEIENEIDNPTEAIKQLNLVRNRADIGDYLGGQSKQEIFEAIDLERRRELVFEGHRWFDILRKNRAESVLDITDQRKLLMPIPASQTETDKSLEQNPGY